MNLSTAKLPLVTETYTKDERSIKERQSSNDDKKYAALLLYRLFGVICSLPALTALNYKFLSICKCDFLIMQLPCQIY